MEYLTMQQVLLCKFPSFDNSWGTDEMCSWFDSFMKIIKLYEDKERE